MVGMPRISCFVRGAEPCIIMMLNMCNIMLAMLITMLRLPIMMLIVIIIKLLIMQF